MNSPSVMDFVKNKILEYAPSVLFAIVTVIVGIFLTKVIKKAIKKAFSKIGKSDSRFLPLSLKLSRIGIMIICLLLILSKFNVPVTALFTIISSALVAVGLGLKDFFCGVAKSLQIFTIRPYAPGELIEIDGKKGVVEKIDYLHTYITNDEYGLVMVPNTLIADKSIINYSRGGKKKEQSQKPPENVK